MPAAEKADLDNRGHVAAPFAGVVTVSAAEGCVVRAGQTVATIEAMKMEAAITAPKAGSIAPTAVSQIAQVGGGDMLIILS